MSMSTARQTVWLDTRVVPWTKREWPERRQLRRIVWRSAITAVRTGPRSSWPEARSVLGSQPWLVVLAMRLLRTSARTNGSLDGDGTGAVEV